MPYKKIQIYAKAPCGRWVKKIVPVDLVIKVALQESRCEMKLEDVLRYASSFYRAKTWGREEEFKNVISELSDRKEIEQTTKYFYRSKQGTHYAFFEDD